MIYFRYKYSEGVFAGQFQNSGVKMLIPLVVKTVECVSESSDIKMILTEQGKQGGQCTHPCIFGDGKPPFTEGCKLLTVGDLRRAHER